MSSIIPAPSMKRFQIHGIEHPCPACGAHGDGEKGDGKHHGPIPWPHCLRCGGFGTVIRMPEANVDEPVVTKKRTVTLTERVAEGEESFEHF